MAEETNDQATEATEDYQASGTRDSADAGTPENKGTLSRLWNNLNLPARVGIIAVSIITLGLIAMFSITAANPPDKEVLYRRLDPVQAREVADALDEMEVDYELEDEGTTILVPEEERDRLRISLSPDLYAQGIGFSLFENGGLVASDFERRVQLQIALEEELRRTITSLDAVDQARVHLVMPEEGVFIRERKDPSASIFLRLSPLATLSDNQVRGIMSLVAGSVEGLTPEGVSIVDADGNELGAHYATAEGDWMTEDFVPFSSELSFETPTTETGELILERANPSGLEENADEVRIPVQFDLDDSAEERTVQIYHYNAEKDTDDQGNIMCSDAG
ncbi:MAG: flagellar basal-body MS-ring/collar protein FliF, partial [Bacillota bacterium]